MVLYMEASKQAVAEDEDAPRAPTQLLWQHAWTEERLSMRTTAPRFSRALDGGVDGGGRGRTSRCRETNECHTYAAYGAHACMHALPIAVGGAEAHRVGA
jgi:hypothetical protein